MDRLIIWGVLLGQVHFLSLFITIYLDSTPSHFYCLNTQRATKTDVITQTTVILYVK